MEPYEAQIIKEAVDVKDVQRRRTIKMVGVLFLLFFTAMITFSITKYLTVQTAAEDSTALAQRLNQECKMPGVTDPALEAFCPEAEQVVSDAPEQVLTQGLPGPEGPSGEDGADGSDGSDGNDGARGKPGTDGTDGTDGVDGEQGPVGPVGPQGPVGPVGPIGPAGEPGPSGQNGSNGTNGSTNVNDACDPAPEGQYIEDVNYSFNQETQQGTITCTYREDQQGPLGGS